MLSTVVKISNVTNLSDARYCAGMGVDMLGFSLDANDPNYVTPEKFKDIRSWIAGVQLVGETQTEDLDEISELLKKYPLDAIQVSVPAMIPFLVSELKIPILLRVDIDLTEPEGLSVLLSDWGSAVTYLLLESSRNTPVSTSWEQALKQLPSHTPVLLGFGLENIDQIQHFIGSLPIAGISLQGSEELRPGYKDYGMLMDILEALETD